VNFLFQFIQCHWSHFRNMHAKASMYARALNTKHYSMVNTSPLRIWWNEEKKKKCCFIPLVFLLPFRWTKVIKTWDFAICTFIISRNGLYLLNGCCVFCIHLLAFSPSLNVFPYTFWNFFKPLLEYTIDVWRGGKGKGKDKGEKRENLLFSFKAKFGIFIHRVLRV